MIKKYLPLIAALLILAAMTGCGTGSALQTSPRMTEHESPTLAAIGNNVGWTIFTDGNHINGMLLKGNDLWAATAGGVVRWNIQTGTYRKYTTFDGLPGNYVQAIAEDGQGNIVCGTRYGLGIFDGTRWKTLSDGQGFPDFVSAIALDRQNNLLVDTEKGIFRYDGHTWQPLTGEHEGVPPNPGGPAETITGIPPKIIVDQSGNIWDVESYSLSRYEGQKWHDFYLGGLWDRSAISGSYLYGSLNAAVEAPDGSMWVGASFGLLHYNGQVFDFVVPPNLYQPGFDNPPAGITALALDHRGRLLGANDNAILSYDGNSWQTLATNDLSQAPITALVQDGQGDIWCGSWDGLYRFDGQHWKQYLTGDIIPDETTMGTFPADVADGMTVDASGNLWLTSYKGVFRYDGKAWKRFSQADGLADNVVSCIFVDNRGNVWFGTNGFGVSRFDGTNWTTFTTKNGLSSDNITAIAQGKQGNIWVGNHDNKIDRFDGHAWQTYNTQDIMDNNIQSVTSIFRDNQGNLWFATQGAGVMRYDGTDWKTFDRYNGLAADNVESITQDSNGNIWVRSNGGASRFDGTSWQNFNNIGSNYVHPMVADDSGNVWFGTDQGAQMYDGTNWHTFTTADGLPNNVVVAIAVAQDGSLWFATENGVSHYDGYTWHNYTVADGLAVNATVNNDIVVGQDGSVWFDSSNEISRFLPPSPGTPASSSTSPSAWNELKQKVAGATDIADSLVNGITQNDTWLPSLSPEGGESIHLLSDKEKDKILQIALAFPLVREVRENAAVSSIDPRDYLWKSYSHPEAVIVSNTYMEKRGISPQLTEYLGEQSYPGVFLLFHTKYDSYAYASMNIFVDPEQGNVVYVDGSVTAAGLPPEPLFNVNPDSFKLDYGNNTLSPLNPDYDPSGIYGPDGTRFGPPWDRGPNITFSSPTP